MKQRESGIRNSSTQLYSLALLVDLDKTMDLYLQNLKQKLGE
jgi:hypothetical protein